MASYLQASVFKSSSAGATRRLWEAGFEIAQRRAAELGFGDECPVEVIVLVHFFPLFYFGRFERQYREDSVHALKNG